MFLLLRVSTLPDCQYRWPFIDNRFITSLMSSLIYDPFVIFTVVLGAGLAGFTTGFAGFGTALVASGLWFHVLPAPLVPPLVVLAAVVAQLVGLITVRKSFQWGAAAPYLFGGFIGVPVGIVLLQNAAPNILRVTVGVLLIGYAIFELGGHKKWSIGARGGKPTDGLIGLGGGVLGGFAGLSGPLPFIWLQLRGGARDGQRAVYQPFNLLILALASLGMGLAGQITKDVLNLTAMIMLPTLAGAWLGVRVYRHVSDKIFRRVILFALLGSGAILIGQMFVG